MKKYEYETKTIEISCFSIEGELNEMAEKGWRFVGFVPKTTREGGAYYEGVKKLAEAIFEREKYKDKMAFGMP